MKKALILILFISLCFAGTYSGGNGTEADPYQISNLNDLAELSQTATDWDKSFIQTSDIDAGETSEWNSGLGWSPIGNANTKFTGSYDGQGRSIDSLFINRPDSNYVGFFGYLSTHASVLNLSIGNTLIIGSGYVGGLAGYIYYYCTVSNCSVEGNITGRLYVGGIAGNINFSCDILSCYSDGTITGQQSYVGGIAGYLATSQVKDNYSRATVIGDEKVGGFVGSSYQCDFYDCYSTGRIEGNSYTGGFVGSALNVSYTHPYKNCFWDINTSEISSSAQGTGLTTATMMLSETYTNKGWDFTDTWGILGAVNDGYPYLQSFVTLSVPVVTTDTVSLISNNSATVTYRLDNPGLPEASEHGICWNLSGTPTILDTRNSDSYLASENLFAIDLDSLDEFTLYSVRAYVISETDTVYGESISFTTYKAPVVGILSLSVLDTASVTVTSEIENVGYPEISRHGFAWKALSDSDDFHVINLGNTGSIGEFSSGINGLAPNTEYAIYAFAENYCAIVYTDTITFTTLGLPVVTTLSIMEINTAEVTIEAYINDTGNPFASQHGFCWSTDIDPSIEDMKIELGAIDSTGNFLTTIDSLLQNTTYYVCAFATNDLGTVYGDTISFRTLGFATICGMSVSNIDTTSATLSAEILSLGNPRVNEHGFIWEKCQ